MKNLYKNCMFAIERDHYEPELRGKAFINLKNVPNGHYTIYYLRIGFPINITSRLKVLGKASGIFINIKRETISECKKPQLDIGSSSSRISKKETSKFKILKAKASRERDNKIINLNADDESEEEPNDLVLALDKLNKKEHSEGQTRSGSTPEDSLAQEMEFDYPNETQTPQPQQRPDSKQYYENSQRMSEAMIRNPQFQIFSISEDERESMVTSIRESAYGENQEERITVDSIDIINAAYDFTPGENEDALRDE